MSESTTSQIPTGRAPNQETEFYLAWGRESLKSNLTFANEVLRQLVTLNATLLGGSVVFLEDALVGGFFRACAIAAFLFALVFSFLGMMPYEARVPLQMPYELKEHKERALSSKRFYLWVSGGCMAVGFGFVITGLIILYVVKS